MRDDESPQDHKPEEECLMTDIIAGRKATGKFFYQYGFGEILSSVAQKRLTEIICGLAMKGNQSRTTDFARAFDSYGRKKRLKNIGNTREIQSNFLFQNIVITRPPKNVCKREKLQVRKATTQSRMEIRTNSR